MAKTRGILRSIANAQREAARQERVRQRNHLKAARDLERVRRERERAQARAEKAAERDRILAEKEQQRLYLEERQAEVALLNEELEQEIEQLETLLHATLSVDDYFDLDRLRVKSPVPPFKPGNLAVPEESPQLEDYLPVALTFLQKLVPGAHARHQRAIEEGQARYASDLAKHAEREQERQAELARLQQHYDDELERIKAEEEAKNAEIEQFRRDHIAGSPQAIIDYYTLVLEASSYPEAFPRHYRIGYIPESKQLVVEADLPPFEIVPEVSSYKYIKAKDEITSTNRPVSQRKTLYSSIIAQIAVRTLHEIFEADRLGHVDSVVYSGFVDSIDRSTGRPTRPCLVTVRATKDVFVALNLGDVDAIACLKGLSASVSKSPSELAPVRPVLEFNMVDPRFIQEVDVLSALDQRTNLMELSPVEFEALISNLFSKMGLETRATQASRDGGVDCVAYDPRPIFGGKVVIQAKRYKNTVGVSAVRDLFGTLQNEGASKGILVTTSGYGKAAYEFAEGKPLELLSGSHLLHLLAEHAGIQAKIEIPEDWRDPQPDAS